jgi:hypothetical protein
MFTRKKRVENHNRAQTRSQLRFVIISPMRIKPTLSLAAAALVLVGCGSSSKSHSSTTTPPTTTPRTAAANPAVPAGALHPPAGLFPQAGGRTLRQLAGVATGAVQFGPATGVFVPGDRRIAFAMNTSAGAFVYAPTALYIARSPDSPAAGPFLAPADPVGVAPQYRSSQNAGPGGIAAIYSTTVPVPHPGTYRILALSRVAKGFVGGTGEIAVARSSPIPDVGQRAPAVATDTLASVHGNRGLLTTRVPPEQMAAVSLTQVLGRRPVALLISTPRLCTSRVCGPVTDVLVSLQHQFAGRIAFIHQEVFVDNQPSKGLRPTLTAFHLETEPWLFTIDRHGVIVDRLEGAFGVNEATRALADALR